MSLKDRSRRLKTEIPAQYISIRDKNTPLPPRGRENVAERQA